LIKPYPLSHGEDNRDGDSHNRSWNHGVEGPTDDPEVHALRERQKRNFLTTLMLSQGVPMLAHGDELGRTQAGNNNVYAQDNELSGCCPSSILQTRPSLKMPTFVAALVGPVTGSSSR